MTEKKSSTVRFKLDPASPPKLTAAQRARLDALREEDIDYSDIPDLITSGLAQSMYRPLKQVVTIRLDSDVVAWFKSQQGRYQTAINAALRQHIAQLQQKGSGEG